MQLATKTERWAQVGVLLGSCSRHHSSTAQIARELLQVRFRVAHEESTNVTVMLGSPASASPLCLLLLVVCQACVLSRVCCCSHELPPALYLQAAAVEWLGCIAALATALHASTSQLWGSTHSTRHGILSRAQQPLMSALHSLTLGVSKAPARPAQAVPLPVQLKMLQQAPVWGAHVAHAHGRPLLPALVALAPMLAQVVCSSASQGAKDKHRREGGGASMLDVFRAQGALDDEYQANAVAHALHALTSLTTSIR